MPAKGRSQSKEKVNKEMVKVVSPIGVQHVMSIGSQAVAHKDIIVQSIIQGDSQADVLLVALLATTRLNAHVQSSLKPRTPSGMRPHGSKMKLNGKNLNGRLTSMKRPRKRKDKGKESKHKGNPRARMYHGLLHLDRHNLNLRKETDPNPKPNDFLFAMMSTKSKPSWRHSTWNGTDYMICTVADPQKKLPVFKQGNWTSHCTSTWPSSVIV